MIVSPAAFIFGVVILGIGWRSLWNCSGWWPADRRNIGFGVPLCGLGAILIFWSIGHALFD
jgi:hypothetical protein